MEENFRNIYKAIQEADALLIGASNGLSISEGYNIFADDHLSLIHISEPTRH